MPKPLVIGIVTEFWKPKENYMAHIIDNVKKRIEDGDLLVLSEKAIATSLNNIVDETQAKPSLSARIIAKLWMRIVWGYLLGTMCHFKPKLIAHLRNYPFEEGSCHKQVALQYAGLAQALMFGSEGGIDGSNLGYSYVSLPLYNSGKIAEEIRQKIQSELKKNVSIMISDTDRTYSFRNFHFTSRPRPIKGIHSFGGFMTFVAARMFNLKRRATPLAIAGCKLDIETSLDFAESANRARGVGAGRTVWDMAAKFEVGLTEVTWEMLERVKHKPIVIVKSRR